MELWSNWILSCVQTGELQMQLLVFVCSFGGMFVEVDRNWKEEIWGICVAFQATNIDSFNVWE